jgi:hypothetical protein
MNADQRRCKRKLARYHAVGNVVGIDEEGVAAGAANYDLVGGGEGGQTFGGEVAEEHVEAVGFGEEVGGAWAPTEVMPEKIRVR